MPREAKPAGARSIWAGVTVEEVRALPVVVPVLDAARVFRMGTRASRAARRDGTFPVPVHTINGALCCYRADVLRAIGEPVGVEAQDHSPRGEQ